MAGTDAGLATTPEQHAIRDAVRAWATRHRPVAVVRAEQGWQELWPSLAELGVFAVAVGQDQGGAGGTVLDLAVMLEALSSELAPGPVLGTATAALVLDRTGRTTALEDLTEGRTPCAVAPVGSTPLRRNREDGTVAGTLPPVPGLTSGVALLAPADDGWVLIAPGAAGLVLEPAAGVDHGTDLAGATLTGVEVVEAGLPSQEVELVLATLAAAQAAGTASWALGEATAYAKVRTQFGAPIGSFQSIKHLCAWMLCRREQAKVAAWDAAVALDGSLDPREREFAVCAATALVLDAAVDNTAACIQVHGGIGFTWEHDTHLHLRRALTARAQLGGSDRWRRRTAELAAAGTRRVLSVDLGEVEAERSRIAEIVADVAAVDESDRRAALAGAGLIAPHWPAPHGLGAGPALQVLVDQECARAGLARPDLVIGWWAIPPILQAGTPEQIERFVPPTLAGDLQWCQLFSEPGAGSDLASLTTRARRVEGGFVLSGQKVWNSFALTADFGICLARTDPDVPKHQGITFFLVDMRSPGIEVRPLREITGKELFNEVFLDDVFVPDEHVVGPVGGGWPLARVTLANERVQMSGGGRLGQEIEEILRRVPGMTEGEKELAGSLVAQSQSVMLLAHRAVLGQIAGAGPGAESAVQKLAGVRTRQGAAEFLAARFPAEAAVEGEVSRMLFNTRQLSIAGGSEQILLTLAGERILGLPR